MRPAPSEKHTLYPLISNHQRRSDRRVAGRKSITFMLRRKVCMRVYQHPDFVLYPVTPTVHARILPVLFCTNACSPINSTEVCADTLFVSCKLRAPLAGLGFRVYGLSCAHLSQAHTCPKPLHPLNLYSYLSQFSLTPASAALMLACSAPCAQTPRRRRGLTTKSHVF